MPEHINKPAKIEAVGNVPKEIREYIGRANTGSTDISIARMSSPSGWVEPGQRPEFDEYTIVLNGCLHVEHDGGTLEISAGEALISRRGEWVRYSTPGPDGADYLAICMPAFSPGTVHRDDIASP